MPTMTNEQDAYIELLKNFPSTLKETSKDDSGLNRTPPEPVYFMTNCLKPVISFDAFKNSIVQKGWIGRPNSCDALYRYDENTWFLIEFKNGSIEFPNKRQSNDEFRPNSSKFYEIIRKLLESLLMLTEKLGQTIEFTRNNLVFVLVYNEENNEYLNNLLESKGGYQTMKDKITKLGYKKARIPMTPLSKILPEKSFNTAYFDKLYVKGAYICSKKAFNIEFVKTFVK